MSPMHESAARSVTILRDVNKVVAIYVMTLRERLPRRSTFHEQVELRKLKNYVLLFACLQEKAIRRGVDEEAETMQTSITL